MLAKKNVSFALFFCITLLASHCECNIYGDNPKQQHRPPDLDQYTSDHRDNSPLPPSASETGPPRIGLDVNGRIKSLLWRNPRAFLESTLTPLFSSSREFEDEEGEGHQETNAASHVAEGIENSKNDPKQRGLAPYLLPGAIYGTADYRFRKERWYGVEKIGMIFRWNRPHPWSQCNNKAAGEESKGLRAEKIGSVWLPTTLDISADHSLLSPSKTGWNEVFTSLVDSGSVRIGWDHDDEGGVIGVSDANPWIQVGVNPQYTISKADSEQKNPIFMRFFVPLIRRRFNFQWTSHWENASANFLSEKFARNGDYAANEWSSKNRKAGDDPWWIPQVSLDPSMGTLSSGNRYRSSILGKDNRQYLTEFKLRIRTTMPTILSSVTTNMMATSDDDDLQTASLRLEYSLMTDPGQRIPPILGATCTTARFETIIIPSFWLRSVRETSKFGLIHEQSHVTER